MLFGVAAVKIIKVLAIVAGSATGFDTARMSFSLTTIIVSPESVKNIYLSTPLLALALLVLGIIGFAIYKLPGRAKSVLYKTWDCGYYALHPRNEYTATAFSKPFRIAFSFFLLPYRKTHKIRESFYHVKSFTYETHTTKVFQKYIYDPVLSLVFKSAKFMRRLQPGSIHLYLAYIFITLVVLLIFVRHF